MTIEAETYKAGEVVSVTCEAKDILGNVQSDVVEIEYTNSSGGVKGKIVPISISGKNLKLVPQDDNGKLLSVDGCTWKYRVHGSSTAGTSV